MPDFQKQSLLLHVEGVWPELHPLMRLYSPTKTKQPKTKVNNGLYNL